MLTERLKTAGEWIRGRSLPIEKNKIVVTSFYGRGYGDNPKGIVNELLKRKADVKIVWLVSGAEARESLPDGVAACDYDSPEKIRELSTAKIWIDNSRKGARFKKAGQFYLQTWHGFALKRIEKDVADKLPPEYAEYARRDSEQCDLIVSNSAFMTKIYRESFWYGGEVEEFGSPRNDALFGDASAAVKKVRAALPIPEGKKLLLYAPTFRADCSLDAYSLDYAGTAKALAERFGGDWAVLIRLHPHVVELAKDLKFDNELTFDATAYDDMQELLAAADAVITDYSSLMFDFALTRRPCFQFATDIEAYRGDRNFYFPLDELPFPLAVDNAGLCEKIREFDDGAYLEKWDAFCEKVGMKEDGRASERCADWILGKMKEA
jgi:CDP-glycerol glycerophosphotransferase